MTGITLKQSDIANNNGIWHDNWHRWHWYQKEKQKVQDMQAFLSQQPTQYAVYGKQTQYVHYNDHSKIQCSSYSFKAKTILHN